MEEGVELRLSGIWDSLKAFKSSKGEEEGTSWEVMVWLVLGGLNSEAWDLKIWLLWINIKDNGMLAKTTR